VALAIASAAMAGADDRAGTNAPCADRPAGLDAYMPAPDDNRPTPDRVALGRALFFDRRLSANGSLSCAACHDPARAFTDGRPIAIGIHRRRGRRNAPTLINRGYGTSHFWDGRAAGLEAQALEPIQNASELGADVETIVERLAQAASYRQAFQAAYGRAVSADVLAQALASYIRTIVASEAPLDQYLAGERSAMPAVAQEGLRLFRGRGNCTACHLGPNLTDERFHNTGVAWRSGRMQDEGRAGVTGAAADRGAFKTPTLREVARTAPYMHDGSVSTLAEVVESYDRGGTPNPHLDPEIRPLRLTPPEMRALVAFLEALSGRVCEAGRPAPAR
jgi:cytochrome c peroxidase